MAAINFLVQSDKAPSAIYIRFKDGRNFDIKPNFVINPANWSNAKGQPKNLKDATFKKLDANLINLKTKFLNHYNNSTSRTAINTQWLKNFINQ